MKAFLLAVGGFLALTASMLGACLVWGGPAAPEGRSAIVDTFQRAAIDPPALQSFKARDGTELAYRNTPAESPERGSVVLVHGSAGDSRAMQPLAKSLAAAGLNAYALDIRGHGDSGPRGRIAYVGQLEDDLADFLAAVQPPAPRLLAGFSSGGGFALRVAAGPDADAFDGYLLLAPFVSHEAPTYRPDAGGWVRVGVPRLIALHLLDGFGIRAFHHLPVMRFAVDANSGLTPSYGFRLAINFRPRTDWRAEVAAVARPTRVLVGGDDAVFHPQAFAEVFARQDATDIPVRVLPGIGHAGVVLDPAARRGVVEAADALLSAKPVQEAD
jgi:alpha-beta hydrolase superfamily lysophospholipase